MSLKGLLVQCEAVRRGNKGEVQAIIYTSDDLLLVIIKVLYDVRKPPSLVER